MTSQVAKELSKMASFDTPYITFYERFVGKHLYCAPFARQCQYVIFNHLPKLKRSGINKRTTNNLPCVPQYVPC